MKIETELKPLHKDKFFNSEKEYKDWLKKLTYKKIELKDKGQDLSTMHISDTGEIIGCDFNSDIYLGRFVNLERLAIHRVLWVNFEEDWTAMRSLIIEKIS